jgi:hypothetical protein
MPPIIRSAGDKEIRPRVKRERQTETSNQLALKVLALQMGQPAGNGGLR